MCAMTSGVPWIVCHLGKEAWPKRSVLAEAQTAAHSHVSHHMCMATLVRDQRTRQSLPVSPNSPVHVSVMLPCTAARTEIGRTVLGAVECKACCKEQR